MIGFAGAPFTLASYAIEGRGSRNYVWVKKMMYSAPQLLDALMTKLVDTVADYVNLQIDAGVDAVQLLIRGSAACRWPIGVTLRGPSAALIKRIWGACRSFISAPAIASRR